MSPVKTDLLYMREMNRRLILDTIRRNGKISRAEIATITKLNPSTVTRIVADLIREGLVREIGTAASQGGRRPILIDLVPDAVHIIGIDVETTTVVGVVTNMVGTVVYSAEQQLQSKSQEAVVSAIFQVISALQAQASDRQIIGIGVAMHGLVDSERGISLYPPAFGWKNLPLASHIAHHFHLPVRIENNARAMALGEWWFGAGRDLDNFIVLKVGYGIGSGIILNNHIFHGIDYAAGEIGHTTVNIDGPLCDCGNHGCLETLASVKAIIKNAQQALYEGEDSILRSMAPVDNLTLQHIHQAANMHDPLALRLLTETGRYLGIAIASLINVLNPTKILLGGDILPVLDYVLPTMETTVQARALAIPAKRVTITPIQLGEFAAAIGAVTLIIESIFKPVERESELF